MAQASRLSPPGGPIGAPVARIRSRSPGDDAGRRGSAWFDRVDSEDGSPPAGAAGSPRRRSVLPCPGQTGEGRSGQPGGQGKTGHGAQQRQDVCRRGPGNGERSPAPPDPGVQAECRKGRPPIAQRASKRLIDVPRPAGGRRPDEAAPIQTRFRAPGFFWAPEAASTIQSRTVRPSRVGIAASSRPSPRRPAAQGPIEGSRRGVVGRRRCGTAKRAANGGAPKRRHVRRGGIQRGRGSGCRPTRPKADGNSPIRVRLGRPSGAQARICPRPGRRRSYSNLHALKGAEHVCSGPLKD